MRSIVVVGRSMQDRDYYYPLFVNKNGAGRIYHTVQSADCAPAGVALSDAPPAASRSGDGADAVQFQNYSECFRPWLKTSRVSPG